MPRLPLRRFQSVVLAIVACTLPIGCGDGKLVRLTGQVVSDGEVYRLGEGESLQLDISTADDAYPPLALGTFAKRDGSFVVDLNDGTGRGLPPGKYKLRLNSEGTSLNTKVNPRLFKEAHPLEVEKRVSRHLTLDLSSGTITP